jgi:hypothetical protein
VDIGENPLVEVEQPDPLFHLKNSIPLNKDAAGRWNDIENERGPISGVVEIDPIRVRIEIASVAIHWNSHSRSLYQVQYATALAPTIWLHLGGPVLVSGTNNVVFDSVLEEPRRFYRVNLLP